MDFGGSSEQHVDQSSIESTAKYKSSLIFPGLSLTLTTADSREKQQSSCC